MIKVLFFLDFKNDFAFLGLCEFHRNSQGCGLISKDRLEVGDKRLEKKQTSDNQTSEEKHQHAFLFPNIQRSTFHKKRQI